MKGVLIYLVLVGIPIAGVLGVLRLGRDITPAPYVGGTWSATIRPDSVCVNHVVNDTSTMVVSQSGTHLTITFTRQAPARLKGRIYGPHFSVATERDSVRLHAVKMRERDRMRGMFVGFPCAAARTTFLRGVRIAPPGAVGSH